MQHQFHLHYCYTNSFSLLIGFPDTDIFNNSYSYKKQLVFSAFSNVGKQAMPLCAQGNNYASGVCKHRCVIYCPCEFPSPPTPLLL